MLPDMILIESAVILLLILLNGLLSLSEMAVVSARKNRLEQKAESGSRGAASALELAENPNRFLSTVQVGITLIGILSGAVGGATIADQIGYNLGKISWLAPYSEGIGVTIVVLMITYLSLVLGELVPKRVALNNAETAAAFVAPLMKTLSKLAAPVVGLLTSSTDLVLRLLGIQPSSEPEVTQEDLQSMLDQATEEGIFEETEQDMVRRIFRLGDRSISTLMTPRTDIVFLDINATHDDIFQKIAHHPFSRFPVMQNTADDILGIVQARDLLLQRVEGSQFRIHEALQQPLFIPEATSALNTLGQFKSSRADLAIVIDEYGGVLGLVSLNDILEAIVGDMLIPVTQEESEAFQREDGSWLFDGMILADDLKEYLHLTELPGQAEGTYETLSGLMMSRLGRIPSSGDFFEWADLRFEVVDMDGRRVDKVLVSPTLPKLSADWHK